MTRSAPGGLLSCGLVLEAAFWGLVQGLSEFLPISSSGHLVIVPAALDMEAPDLAVTAVLHLGTLAAVLAYYRTDVVKMVRLRGEGRRIVALVLAGTIPAAAIGLAFESQIDDAFDDPRLVGWALVATGVVLWASGRLAAGKRVLGDGKGADAAIVGLAQAAALVPGISRSGVTITAGLGRRLTRAEAARYSFLLAIPAIAGGGFLQLLDLAEQGGLRAEVFVGAAVAAVTGYAAIGLLLKLLERVGLAPFAWYCWAVGAASVLFL